MPSDSVWIGLTVDEAINGLENLSFYLDFPNLTDSYEYLFLLPCTEWYIDGKRIDMQKGIYQKMIPSRHSAYSFFQNYDIMVMIDKEVMDIYNKHYLTISNSLL